MKKNPIVVGAAAAAVLVSLAACSSAKTTTGSGGTQSGSKISIAGVYGNATDPFWASLGCGAKAEAATLGVNYKAYSSANLDTASFSQNFSSAQLAKPQGIFVNPSNPNQFISQYQSLMSSGVPVVTINSSTPAAQYKVVGTDTTSTDFLSQIPSLVTADSGSMAVINGIPGLPPVENRLQPVLKAITSAKPGLKVLPTQYTQFDVTKGTSAVSSLIIAHSDLKVIVAADGPDGQAAAAAVQQAGKAGQITVIALDATPAEVTALKAGTITALIAQAPAQIGAKQVSTLVDYIKAHSGGGAVTASSDTLGVPQKLLTKTNVDDAANSDWVYKASC